MTAASSACTMRSESAAPASAAIAASISSAETGGNSSTPECTRKHLNPKTPSPTSGSRSARLSRHDSAPESDVDEHRPLGGSPLDLERRHRRRRRDAVQRHVDDRRDPARGRGARRRREALPLGASGLVDVHVRVDEPGDEHLVVGEPHDAGGDESGAERRDARDDPVANADLGGRELAVDEHPLAGTTRSRGTDAAAGACSGIRSLIPHRLAVRPAAGPVSRTCRLTSL